MYPLLHNKFIHNLFPENSFSTFTHQALSFTEGCFFLFIYRDMMLRECLDQIDVQENPILSKIHMEYLKWMSGNFTQWMRLMLDFGLFQSFDLKLSAPYVDQRCEFFMVKRFYANEWLDVTNANPELKKAGTIHSDCLPEDF